MPANELNRDNHEFTHNGHDYWIYTFMTRGGLLRYRVWRKVDEGQAKQGEGRADLFQRLKTNLNDVEIPPSNGRVKITSPVSVWSTPKRIGEETPSPFGAYHLALWRHSTARLMQVDPCRTQIHEPRKSLRLQRLPEGSARRLRVRAVSATSGTDLNLQHLCSRI
jgi:hypothetical protein